MYKYEKCVYKINLRSRWSVYFLEREIFYRKKNRNNKMFIIRSLFYLDSPVNFVKVQKKEKHSAKSNNLLIFCRRATNYIHWELYKHPHL